MKQVQDYFFKKAKQENYLARSVYKLKEIDEKHHLFKRDQKILDLGCAPGSWLQYIWERIQSAHKGAFLLGVDLKPIEHPPHPSVIHLAKDIFSMQPVDIFAEIKVSPFAFHGVVSDMAPNTTGNKQLDHEESIELVEKALDFAHDLLIEGGFFLCKIFQGGGTRKFYDQVKPMFHKSCWIKPESSRKESKEIFLLAEGFIPSCI